MKRVGPKSSNARSRGVTLLEILASITLLVSLVAAVGAACLEPARLLARIEPQVSFEESAHALCALIARDLDVLDLDPGELGPRVVVGESALTIRTRDCAPYSGAVVHRFIWDAARGEIRLQVLSRNASRVLREEGTVLAHLCLVSFAIEQNRSTLTISLTSDQHQSIERRWGMP